MFPVTITLHNAAQFSTVMAALGYTAELPAKTEAAAAPAPKPPAIVAPTAAPQAPAATSPESNAASPSEPAAVVVTFDALKNAFLALSTKAGGRALCEGVLKPLGLAKLSEAQEEQYGPLLAAIEASAR
jgi:hypothetical protein